MSWASVEGRLTPAQRCVLRELLARYEELKKALIAVRRSILVIIYHLLARRVGYQDLGEDYFDRHNTAVQRRRLIRRLESLGLKVTAEEIPQAA